MKSTKPILFAVRLAFFAFCLLIIGEVAARLVDAVSILRIQDLPQEDLQSTDPRAALKPIHRYMYYDEKGCFRLLPSVSGIHRSYDHPDKAIWIRVNSEGIRGPELIENPKTRILFIGDSIVFDGGVPFRTTFVHQLGKKLNAETGKEGAGPIEILNFGTTDAGVDQYYLKLKYHGTKLNPDYVFIGFYLNDGVSPQGYLGATNLDGLEKWLESDFMRHFSLPAYTLKLYRRVKYTRKKDLQERFRWVARYRKGKFYHDTEDFVQLISEADLDWGAGWVPERWDKILYYMKKIRKLSEEEGFKPVVFCFPVGPQIYSTIEWPDVDYPQRQIKEIAAQLGIPFFDLLPYLRKYADRQLLNDHCHYNSEGNRVLAEILFGIVQEHEPVFGGLVKP